MLLTLIKQAPTLGAVVMIAWLLIHRFPSIVAVCTKDEARRRAALEVLRLRRKDAAKIPTYLLRGDTDATMLQHSALPPAKVKAERSAAK